MKVTMRFEGGVELAKTLEALPRAVSKRVIREALGRAGEPMRAQMERSAPRDPGAPDLADNIVISAVRMEGLIDDEQAAAIGIGPAKGFYWAWFQEFGTRRHGAQPFIRPAFEGGWHGALAEIRKSFWTALAAVGVSRSIASQTAVQPPDGGDLL